MALAKLTLRQGITKGYYYAATIATGADGLTLPIAPLGLEGTAITCTLIAGANTGKFQVTTSSDAIVAADSAIVWQDWPKNVQTGTVNDTIIGPVTGIRAVSSSGEIKIEIVI